MDEQRLQEIEARAELATKGVWLHTFDQDNHELGNVWGPDGDAIAERVHGNLALGGDGIDNAAFIAHAREDVPALIAEVRRLRADVLQQQAEKVEMVTRVAEQRDAALAERDAYGRACYTAGQESVEPELRDHRAMLAQQQVALTEARRVLREMKRVIEGKHKDGCDWLRPGGLCTHKCNHTAPLLAEVAHVLAQEEK